MKIVLKILIFKIFAKSRRSSLLFYLQTNEWNLRISWKAITTVLPVQIEPFNPTTPSWADHAFEHGGRSSPLTCGISVFLTFGRNKVDNFPTALLWMQYSVLEPSFVTDIQTRCDFALIVNPSGNSSNLNRDLGVRRGLFWSPWLTDQRGFYTTEGDNLCAAQ